MPHGMALIDTARSGAGLSRDSVHFAVNHGVQAHFGGSWQTCEYAVLMPVNVARQTAGNRFVGGVAADFYSKGKVKIPKGSVIVRRNARVPEGKYRISDASKIEQFKQLHGVKIIETASTDMVSDVDNILCRMGYKVKSGEAMSWGGSLSDFNLFNSYLRANGMKPMLHTYTPNGKIEMLIDHLNSRSTVATDWVVRDKAGKVILDYKQEYLQAIKYIEEFAKRTEFLKNFGTKQLAKIIKSSSSPKEAIKLIESQFQIKSMEVIPSNTSELKSFQLFRMLVGGSKSTEITDNLVLDYLKHANKSSLTRMVNAPSGVETIPDAMLVEPTMKSRALKCCNICGLKEIDNTIANRLYELG